MQTVESREPQSSPVGSAWWLVLCLMGLDYFSSLAYLPSLAVQAVGPLAPLAAAAVVLVTLAAALPVYLYIIGRSPHGRGGTGLIEQRVPGWKGKLLVLLLLAFIATDYVVTQNLSVADAAEHIRANPLVRRHVSPWLDAHWRPAEWSDQPWWGRVVALFDRQLVVALILSAATFASWAYWKRGSTERFLRVAVAVVAFYLLLNALIVGSALAYLWHDGRRLLIEWQVHTLACLDGGAQAAGFAGNLLGLTLSSFPYVALGLSGFELSMAVAPLVRGAPDDDPQNPRGRIRNMRKLLVTAAGVMSTGLFASVLVVTVLVPPSAFRDDGPAVHRALAYLAHGGALSGGVAATEVSGLFGPTFGTLYDVSTVVILCLAGACVAIALRDFVPQYLQRLGMELDWAHRLGVKMRFFNLIVLAVVLAFRAKLEALQWVYVTSVLVLLSSASLAAALDVRHGIARPWLRSVAAAPFGMALAFFFAMTLLTVSISRSGLEIAVAFGVGILGTSLVSRWIRSTELRFEGFEFADEDSRRRWEQCCGLDFQVLVPHRPGWHSRIEKERVIRERHRIHSSVPLILVEAELGDPSEFLQKPLMRVTRVDGFDLIQVSRCVSVAHVLAAIGLEMSRVGRSAELHFGWSDESPVAANLNFLLFGEGNIPWMVRELLLKAQPDPEKRPVVVVG
ncbi:MAG: amino acid transporter [Planctomycetaceae bacterium]